jgi:hypothetical protein
MGEHAAAGMVAMFEGVAAEQGNQMFGQAMSDLVSLERSEPGDDVVTSAPLLFVG